MFGINKLWIWWEDRRALVLTSSFINGMHCCNGEVASRRSVSRVGWRAVDPPQRTFGVWAFRLGSFFIIGGSVVKFFYAWTIYHGWRSLSILVDHLMTWVFRVKELPFCFSFMPSFFRVCSRKVALPNCQHWEARLLQSHAFNILSQTTC